MVKSIISETAGRTASIIDVIATGISAAGGNPDVEMVRIIDPSSGLGLKIGKLIMDNLFSFVEEREYGIDYTLDLGTLLRRLRWSPDMETTFPDEIKREELYGMLDVSARVAEKTNSYVSRIKLYRRVALSRRMTPIEIREFLNPNKTAYIHPPLREVLQVFNFNRNIGSTGTKKTVALDASYFDNCVFVDQSGMVGMHPVEEELPVGTEIILGASGR